MESNDRTQSKGSLPTVWPERWSDSRILLLLLALSLLLRAWVLWTTVVPSRDSIGFIRYALQFEKQPWTQVIREAHQHPGYPLTILVFSWPVRYFAGTTPHTMQLSAQLASAFAGLLLSIPLYAIGKLLFNRSAGFWGALLFQCLPASSHTLSDAISDPLFLFFAACGLWAGIVAVRGDNPLRFALCGLLAGVTYLVRPEGVLVLFAAGFSLTLAQILPSYRRRWHRFLACGAALVLAGVLAGAPYFLVTGSFSNKPSARRLTEPLAATGPQASGFDLFAVHISPDEDLRTRVFTGAIALVAELVHTFHYVAWLPLLIGMWWYWDRYRLRPDFWLTFCYCMAQLTAVLLLIVRVGYVSNRHILPVVILCVHQACLVVMELPFRVRRWLPKSWAAWVSRKAQPLALGLVGLLVLWGMPRSLEPLHDHRAGHYAAGLWLRDHSAPEDWIDDDHCWAHYYAGRVLAEGTTPAPSIGPRRRFVVYSRPKDPEKMPPHRRYNEEELRRRGVPVYHWPEGVPLDEADVVVYRIDLTTH